MHPGDIPSGDPSNGPVTVLETNMKDDITGEDQIKDDVSGEVLMKDEDKEEEEEEEGLEEQKKDLENHLAVTLKKLMRQLKEQGKYVLTLLIAQRNWCCNQGKIHRYFI